MKARQGNITKPDLRFNVAFSCLVGAAIFMYGPLYIEFASSVWIRNENAHAPFVLAICVGSALFKAAAIDVRTCIVNRAEVIAGGTLLSLGAFLYAIGRSKGIDLFSSGSVCLVSFGAVLGVLGARGVSHFAFPLVMTIFLTVWPGWMIDMATNPLKQMVSLTVSRVFFSIGFPVAHAGAVITAGPYDLLVADACAGLNSLFALFAAGAVYLHAAGRRSWKTIFIVIAMLAPLAILANIIRVGALVFITYRFGYDAGQSFLHEGAGLVMFAAALLGVFAVDALAASRWERRT